MDYLGGIVNSSREFEEKTGISHAMFGRYNEMTSFMSLDKLEQICSKFPDLKVRIAGYLFGDKDGKHTAATNEAAVFKKEAEKFRKAAEALARVNLLNAQTIAELTSGEVVE